MRVFVASFAQRWLLLLLIAATSGCSFKPPWDRSPSPPDIVRDALIDSGSRQSGSHESGRSKKVSPAAGRAHGQPSSSSSSPLPASGLAAVEACLASGGLPPENQTPAEPSNYDRRLARDAYGRQIPASPMLVVLHETVVSEADTLRQFQTRHADEQQSSYHMLIAGDGRRLRIVPDAQRAFGAGDSAFGNFTVQLKPNTPGSINNVALHLSLVTPPDGRTEADSHSGYSPAQYRSTAAQLLLWQIRYGIPSDRITTHQQIDRSGTRRDPRSFRWDLLTLQHQKLASQCGVSLQRASR